MDQRLIIFSAIAIFVHLALSVVLSKEILDWVPSLRKKVSLMTTVWCIPFIGAIFTYRHLKLDWFRSSTGGQNEGTTISSGILGVEAIFNPGTKHVIDAVQEEYAEVREDGELYKRNYLEGIEMTLKNDHQNNDKT